MTAIRRYLAQRLRFLADRIDYHGAPKATSWSFTVENGEGFRFRTDGRGCRVWYLGDSEYQRAHTEADTEHIQIDWANARWRMVGGALTREHP